MVDRVELCGSLDDIGYPELLKRLHDERATATLKLSHDNVEKSVHFSGGQLIFARSNNPNDRLGEFLLAGGVINLKQYLESSARIAPGKRQGAILCEMGAISPDDLFTYVKEQVTEIICSLFQWPIGRFEVSHDAHGAEETIVLTIPIEDVILKGVRRVDDWARIWKGLGGSLEVGFHHTPVAASLAYHSSLSQDEAHVLSFANGNLDVGRILDLSYAADFETCRILWALLLIGAIEPHGSAMKPAASGEDYALAELVEAFDGVFTTIHSFVAERIGDLVDHFMDRVIQEAARRQPKALRDLYLRNQGRVEYERMFKNLGDDPADRRHEEARRALSDLLEILLDYTARELGPEEEASLSEDLLALGPEVPQVPLEKILREREGRATGMEG